MTDSNNRSVSDLPPDAIRAGAQEIDAAAERLTSPALTSGSQGRVLLTTVVIAFAYLALAWASRALSAAAGAEAAFWLPSGLIAATAVAYGRRAWVGIFIGQLSAEWMLGSGVWYTATLLAMGNLMMAAIITELLPPNHSRSLSRIDRAYPLYSATLFWRCVAAVGIGSSVNGLMGTLAIGPVTDANPFSESLEFAITWMVGDLSAAISLSPLLLAALARRSTDWATPRRWSGTAAASLVLLAISVVIQVWQDNLWMVIILLIGGLSYTAFRYPIGPLTLFITGAQITLVLNVPKIAQIRWGGDESSATLMVQGITLGIYALAIAAAIYRLRLEEGLAELEQSNFALEESNRRSHRSMALLNFTERYVGIGSFEMNLQTQEVKWSDQMYRTFGQVPGQVTPNFELAMGLVHEDDRAGVSAAWQKGMERGRYDHTHRVCVDGKVRWMRGLAEFERNEQGQPIWARGCWHDVTELVLAQQAERELDRAQANSQAKSDFLSTISHEIRTPLNGVIGLAELLDDPALNSATRTAYTRQLASSARLLNDIVSDVLDLSKIESGQLTVSAEPFSLHQLLDELRDSYSHLADSKGLKFELRKSNDLPDRLMGDAVRLRQVLHNLLSNALKHTGSGQITLDASVKLERLRLEVRDTGTGIDADDLGRLFKPFVQVGAATARTGGTGLGLAIVKQLVELMGGQVGVRSVLGRGSDFWIELPVRLAPGADEVRQASSEQRDETSLAGLHILVVEDNPVNTLVVRRLLERAGAVTTCVADGQEALNAIDDMNQRLESRAVESPQTSTRRFDLVLMDIHMPRLDGLTACQILRKTEAQSPERPRLPVLAMSAGVLDGERQEAMEAGMDGFISKPVQLEVLLQTVRAHGVAGKPKG